MSVKKYNGKKSMFSGTLIIVTTNMEKGQKFQMVEMNGWKRFRFVSIMY